MAFSERHPDGNPTGRPSSVISTSSPVSGAAKKWLRMHPVSMQTVCLNKAAAQKVVHK
jgi:hypothetical protein